MKVLNFLDSLIFPDRCAYCGRVLFRGNYVCPKCEKELPRIAGITCRKCGREKDRCHCRGSEKYFSSLCAPFYYEGCVRLGVLNFKFRRGLKSHRIYAGEMAKTVNEKLSEVKFDYVTEVPMHRVNLKERGYNQSLWLAKGLSEILGIEHKPSVLVKLIKTKNQHKITYYLRKGNLIGAFDVLNPEDVEGKTILLCDDISTTGETLNECAKMLWLYGAKEVHCVTLGLTSFKEKDNNNIH